MQIYLRIPNFFYTFADDFTLVWELCLVIRVELT